MDEKDEDFSENSFQKHLEFYKKLQQKILDIKNELEHSKDEKILKHLKERIDALEVDKKRIKNMFKNTHGEDVWDIF